MTYYLTMKHLDPNCVSMTEGYTTLDFALYAQQRGISGASELVAYLRSTWPQMSSRTSTSIASESHCNPGFAHLPPQTRRTQRKYFLFEAARAGCVPCVRHFLTEEKIDPFSRSETHGYSVLDFALYAKDQDISGAEHVLAYLRTTWPQISSLPEQNVQPLLHSESSKRTLHREEVHARPRGLPALRPALSHNATQALHIYPRVPVVHRERTCSSRLPVRGASHA